MDKDDAFAIHDVGSAIQTELSFFEDLGLLYGDMVDGTDKAKVSILIIEKKGFFKELCDHDIEYFNNTLARIQSKAIVSAGEKLREHIQSGCDLIKAWH